MDSKVCTNCKIEKELTEFYKKKLGKFGVGSKCKECEAEYSKQYHQKNKEKQRNRTKLYHENNREKILEKQKKYRENNLEKIKEWRENYKDKNKEYRENNKEKLKYYNKEYREKNKESILEKKKEYSQKNKEKLAEYKKDYRENNKENIKNYQKKYRENNKEKRKERHKNRTANEPLYKLRRNIASLIYQSLKRGGYTKESKTYDILGCEYEFFKEYIESKFEYWMSWENHGKYNGNFNYGFDLDHIIPISSAKTEEEKIKLNHYTNFQPLCSKINRDIKRNKL